MMSENNTYLIKTTESQEWLTYMTEKQHSTARHNQDITGKQSSPKGVTAQSHITKSKNGVKEQHSLGSLSAQMSNSAARWIN